MGMDAALPTSDDPADPERRMAAAVARERGRLGSFIRARVPDAGEAEDILQDVFYEFVEAWRLPEPIEQVGAWLFRVARNRIIDRFRKKREQPLPGLSGDDSDADGNWLDEVLPSLEDGPEAAYARRQLLDQLAGALDALPAEQREVFVAHEVEGLSFQDLAARSGVSVNTLLARKRYAVLALRKRLQAVHDEYDYKES